MGFLDHKYSEKEYNKNTALMTNEISNLMFYTNEFNAGTLLNAALFSLAKQPIKMGDKKVMAAMDARIFELINTMKRDMQKEDAAMFACHANILLSTIDKSRIHGEELLTADERKAQEIIAQSRALMHRTLMERDRIYVRMKEIEAQAPMLDESSTEFMMLENEYSELEQNMNAVLDNLAIYTRRHNDNIKIINTRKIMKGYKELGEKITSAQELNREIAEINKLEAAESGYSESIADSVSELSKDRAGIRANNQPSSTLRNLTAEKKKEQLLGGINSADAPASDEEISPLRKKLGKQ